MLFRKALIRIRKEYHGDQKRLFLYSAIALAASTIFGVIADAFLPFNGGWNALRSAILAPTAVSMFVLGYAISLKLHYKKTSEDPDWTPYRSRLSPTWRRRASAIVGALSFVLVYANGHRIGYTFVSSIFAAIVIALFAFMRTTQEEAKREEFEIPDSRDTHYEAHRRKLELDRAEAQRRRAAEKKAKYRTSKSKESDFDGEGLK